MRYTSIILFCIFLLANVTSTFAQNPIPAFPEIQTVSNILSSNSAQHYLKLVDKENPLLKNKTKKVKQWMVNLKDEGQNAMSFVIRTHKLKPLYQGRIELTASGSWEVKISEAMPGQAVMLLFVADHLDVNRGRMAILPEAPRMVENKRKEAGEKLVEEMHAGEKSLDFERWKLGQLRKYGDEATELPALRTLAEQQLKNYLDQIFPGS